MVKKLFLVTTLVALALSACNGQAAQETTIPPVTDTQVATALVSFTEPPAATETPSLGPTEMAGTQTAAALPTATATATLGTPFPTNAPDCTNRASFVADITIPDNTNVAGGTTFTKTWRIANTGTCVWAPNYTLSHYSEQRMGAPDSVPLAVTYPGQNLDISVELTAPTATGTYQGNFVIKNPEGLIMSIADDSRLWVIINVTVVGGTSTASATATAISNVALSSATVTITGTPPTATATGASSSNITTGKCAFTTDRTKLTEVINAVNAHRARNGLPAYTVSAQLAQAAQRHAIDIACNKVYVHTGTDGSTPRSRVADTGYVAKTVSENVNGNYPPLDGQGAVNWWINDKTDPTHGKNLLSTTFTEIGVGYAFFDNYGFYALVFAQP
ncbi:MAG TPA: NBR1-Ig-like domain-containing protein [Anaerolineales bacterium]|nr:NBR1-Ig-like domain-containing protein [Anaerolineales bacterium]